jgi:UDP-N-acetylmuramyl tripeptide synthase
VAGKGHEHYQEVAGRREPFNDKETLLEFFELLEK